MRNWTARPGEVASDLPWTRARSDAARRALPSPRRSGRLGRGSARRRGFWLWAIGHARRRKTAPCWRRRRLLSLAQRYEADHCVRWSARPLWPWHASCRGASPRGSAYQVSCQYRLNRGSCGVRVAGMVSRPCAGTRRDPERSCQCARSRAWCTAPRESPRGSNPGLHAVVPHRPAPHTVRDRRSVARWRRRMMLRPRAERSMPHPSTSRARPVVGSAVAITGRPEASMLVSFDGSRRSAAPAVCGSRCTVARPEQFVQLIDRLQIVELDVGETFGERFQVRCGWGPARRSRRSGPRGAAAGGRPRPGSRCPACWRYCRSRAPRAASRCPIARDRAKAGRAA